MLTLRGLPGVFPDDTVTVKVAVPMVSVAVRVDLVPFLFTV
jgi:hypothetical protein